jgi:hypothetical protein
VLVGVVPTQLGLIPTQLGSIAEQSFLWLLHQYDAWRTVQFEIQVSLMVETIVLIVVAFVGLLNELMVIVVVIGISSQFSKDT